MSQLEELVFHINPWYKDSAQETFDDYWQQQGWVFISREEEEKAEWLQRAADRLAAADLSCKPKRSYKGALNLTPLQFMLEAMEEGE